jgi:hypothetical protein
MTQSAVLKKRKEQRDYFFSLIIQKTLRYLEVSSARHLMQEGTHKMYEPLQPMSSEEINKSSNGIRTLPT